MEIKAGCQMSVYGDKGWVSDVCLWRERLGVRCLFSYRDKGWVSDGCLVMEIKAGCQMSV